MEKVSREQIRKLFHKVKKLRFPDDFGEVDWDQIQYYSWREMTDNVLYTLYEYQGEVTGIRWKLNQKRGVSRLETCEICRKHHRSSQVGLLTAKTKHLPKNIDYRTRGNYVCLDFWQCNENMKDCSGIDRLFGLILKRDG